jgi:acyl-CoA hydrolase
VSDAAKRILASLSAGDRVFLPGSTGEVPSLSAAISAGEGPPLAITTSFVPGINPPLKSAGRDGFISGPFASGPAGAQASRQMRHLPLSYGAFQRYLEGAAFDAIIIQVGAPGGDGRSSLGTAVEFAPTVMRRSRRLIAVVNPNVPDIPGAPSMRLADADLVVETDEALREYEVGAASPVSDAIARNVAAFVGDGAALQIGLGKVPDALLRVLVDRRGLRLQSGMLSDGVRLLEDAGALDPRFAHTSCVHVGTRGYYEWLRGREGFQVRGCEHTHSPAMLAAVPGLVAVNSALSVDLFGQANLETLDGRAVSGVGGAADFARAASLSPTGISIVALPATAGNDRASRIVPRLDAVISLPRQDIDVVVTEFGAADLRGRSVMERAARLISIADPSHHDTLESAWRTLAARL